MKLETNLASIIKILSEEHWNCSDTSDISSFEIERKIQHNDLMATKAIIDDYVVHYARVAKIYTEFDLLGSNKSISINELTKELNTIDDELFSDTFKHVVQNQRTKFNEHFMTISNELYGEKYILNAAPSTNKNGQRDIAYTLFADEENIPCLHFLLNDKKELMDDKQLVKIADLVGKNNIQFVASILKDKLPEEINKEEYFVIKLSQNDKLFKIE